MKILVLSDSHSGLSFMRRCIDRVKPDAVIHLGDYFDDGTAMSEEYPHIRFHQVPGNCDAYRMPHWQHDILSYPVFGVNLYMTHGHKHHVKQTMTRLLSDARESKAAAVLYGHTHIPNCYQEPDGLWVLNPGSCGSFGGSAALMLIENSKIIDCRILRLEDLEDLT